MNQSATEPTRTPAKKTLAQKEALRHADHKLCADHPGQHVAFVDEWNGEELTRTVLVATTDGGSFYEQFDRLPSDVRARAGYAEIPEPGAVDSPSAWLE